MAKSSTTPTGPTVKAGYPTLERPYDWGYTDEQGQPHPCVLTAVGERQRVSVLVALPDGWQPRKDIATGTRGEPGTVHFLDPQVKV